MHQKNEKEKNNEEIGCENEIADKHTETQEKQENAKENYCSECGCEVCGQCLNGNKHKQHIKMAFLMGGHKNVGQNSPILKFYKKAVPNLLKYMFEFL